MVLDAASFFLIGTPAVVTLPAAWIRKGGETLAHHTPISFTLPLPLQSSLPVPFQAAREVMDVGSRNLCLFAA